jgi:hypothetical protein
LENGQSSLKKWLRTSISKVEMASNAKTGTAFNYFSYLFLSDENNEDMDWDYGQ